MPPLPEWIDLPRRKNPRAKHYDYSTPGVYVITQCVQNRVQLLSRVAEGRLELTGVGRLVRQQLLDTAARHEETFVDSCCPMPDHLHFILTLRWMPGRMGISVIDFMREFKSLSARAYASLRDSCPKLPPKLWQRSYDDEIMVDDDELYRYREYIRNNPLAWQLRKDGQL